MNITEYSLPSVRDPSCGSACVAVAEVASWVLCCAQKMTVASLRLFRKLIEMENEDNPGSCLEWTSWSQYQSVRSIRDRASS